MKQRDKSYLWFVIPLLAFLVMLGIIGASMAEGANAVDQVPKLISRSTPADSLHARDGVLYADLFDSMIVVTVRVSDKVITDTIWGSGGDTTRVLGTTFTDTLRVGGRAYFGWAGFAAYLDSALVDSMTQQLGRFAPGGAGTGDIEGVTAGNGLSGGGITGTVTLDIKPGWGLYIHDDSVKVRFTDLLDSLTNTDSSAIIYSTDRVAPYSDTGIAIGAAADGMMMDFTRADTILAFVGIYYGEGIADSMLMSRRYVESAIGDSVAGKLDGINSQNGITGSASQGTATIEIDWPWLRNFIDTCTATIPHAMLADSATRLDTTTTSIHTFTGDKIHDSLADHWAAFIADAPVSVWDSLHKHIDTIEALYSKIDTTSAKIPTASLADSTNGGAIRAETVDTSNQHLAVKTDITDSITSFLGQAKTISGNWVNTANPWADNEVSNTLTIDTATQHLAVKTDITDSITSFLGQAKTISGNWVNTANPWADNEVADNITAGYADSTGKTTHGSINLWDLATNSVDSTKIVDAGVGYADLGVGAVNRIKATVVDSATGALRASLLIAGQGSANTAGRLTLDSLIADTLFATRGNFTNLKVGSDAFITNIAGNALAVSGSTLNAVAGTNNGLSITADSLYIDTTKIARFEELRANWLIPWPDSVLGLGSGQGLVIGSSVTLGTDITDDTLVVDYYPEYTDAVLADLIIPTWKDSIDIYGYIDTVAGMGNTMYFNDSTLTSGLHRRGLQVTIKHPMRVDSLRYIIVQGLVKDSSATNTMWLKGMLRTSTFRAANIDSNAASTIKDYDSLGGDYTDAATVRQFVLSGGAITEGSPWYLLLIARHGSGTAWNWAQVGRIRAVYSRTRL